MLWSPSGFHSRVAAVKVLPAVSPQRLCGRRCLPRLRAGAEPGHGSVQHLRRGQRRLQSRLLHGQPDGGELQQPAQPDRLVVQPVRTGQPQRLSGRPGAPWRPEDQHRLGHLETQWSATHHQVRDHEDQEDRHQQLRRGGPSRSRGRKKTTSLFFSERGQRDFTHLTPLWFLQ